MAASVAHLEEKKFALDMLVQIRFSQLQSDLDDSLEQQKAISKIGVEVAGAENTINMYFERASRNKTLDLPSLDMNRLEKIVASVPSKIRECAVEDKKLYWEAAGQSFVLKDVAEKLEEAKNVADLQMPLEYLKAPRKNLSKTKDASDAFISEWKYVTKQLPKLQAFIEKADKLEKRAFFSPQMIIFFYIAYEVLLKK